MSELAELKTTYCNFLNQLLKTKCLYKNESQKDIYVIKRMENLYKLIETVKTDNISARITSYIVLFNDIVNSILNKKNIEFTNFKFFQYFCKVLEKKK